MTTLWGCSINSGSARLAELAAQLGFGVIWIELEHASVDLAQAEYFCLAATAGGALPLVRTAGAQRDQILHALEVGAKIVVVPMVNDAATARQVVQHGKFPPLGHRGYNTLSRGLGYSVDPDAVARANDATRLLVQVETLQAVANLDEIMEVEGLAGIFVGPGDLSAELGEPGRSDNPGLITLVRDCIRRIRARNLMAGIYTGEGPLLQAALQAGADLCIVAGDIAAVVETWRAQLDRLSPSR